MRLDLHDPLILLKSWLATLHAGELTVRPRLVGPLPGWAQLLRTAAAWHVVYALVAYAGAVVLARSESTSAVAVAVREGGPTAVLLAALVIWWSGIGLSTVLWWAGVRRARGRG